MDNLTLELIEELKEARLQIEYLHLKLAPKWQKYTRFTTETTIGRIDKVLQEAKTHSLTVPTN